MTPQRGNTILHSATHLAVSLYLCSSGSNARGSRGSETETRELLGGTEENSVSQTGVIDLPSRQINEFSQKGNRKKLS